MSFVPKFFYIPRKKWTEDSDVLEPGENYWKFEDGSEEEKKSENGVTKSIKDLSMEDKAKQHCFKKILGILNKVTPDKFQTLMEDMKFESIDVGMLADVIFSKALVDEVYSEMYAKLCEWIMSELSDDHSISFERVLIFLCETGYDNLIDFTDTDLNNVHEDKRYTFRRRLMTMMRFIGELACIKKPIFSRQYIWKMAECLIAKGEDIHLEAVYFLLFTISVRNNVTTWSENIEEDVRLILEGTSRKGNVNLEIKHLFVKLNDLKNRVLKRSYYYRWTEGIRDNIVYKTKATRQNRVSPNNPMVSNAEPMKSTLIFLKPIGLRIDKFGFGSMIPPTLTSLNICINKPGNCSNLNNGLRPQYEYNQFSTKLLHGEVVFFGHFPDSNRLRNSKLLTILRRCNDDLKIKCQDLKTISKLSLKNNNMAQVTFAATLKFIDKLKSIDYKIYYKQYSINLWPIDKTWEEVFIDFSAYCNAMMRYSLSQEDRPDITVNKGNNLISSLAPTKEQKRKIRHNSNVKKNNDFIRFLSPMEEKQQKIRQTSGSYFLEELQPKKNFKLKHKKRNFNIKPRVNVIGRRRRRKLNRFKLLNRMKVEASYIEYLSPIEEERLRQGRKSIANKLKSDISEWIMKILHGPNQNSPFNIALVCLGTHGCITKICFREIKWYINKMSSMTESFAYIMHRYKELTIITFEDFDTLNWFKENVNCEVSSLRKTPLKFVCVDLDKYQNTKVVCIGANCDLISGRELLGIDKGEILEIISHSNDGLSTSKWDIIEISLTSNLDKYQFEVIALIDFNSVQILESLNYCLNVGENEANAKVSQLPYSINWNRKYNKNLKKKEKIRRRCVQRSQRAYKTGIAGLVFKTQQKDSDKKEKTNDTHYDSKVLKKLKKQKQKSTDKKTKVTSSVITKDSNFSQTSEQSNNTNCNQNQPVKEPEVPITVISLDSGCQSRQSTELPNDTNIKSMKSKKKQSSSTNYNICTDKKSGRRYRGDERYLNYLDSRRMAKGSVNLNAKLD